MRPGGERKFSFCHWRGECRNGALPHPMEPRLCGSSGACRSASRISVFHARRSGFHRSGEAELKGGVEAKAFFTLLLQNTIEGFFADPLYGGDRDMVGWKLIGFPGARYDYRDFVSRHGQPYPLPPVAIGGRPEWNRS